MTRGPWSIAGVLAMVCFGCIGDIGGRPDGTNPSDSDGPGHGVTETDPGRVTIHRLNRVEYNNTVRDLLGTSLQPANDFPADDHSFGFDNIADALTISPLQLELYERAAETLAEEALESTAVSGEAVKTEAETLTGDAGAATGTGWNLTTNGSVGLSHSFPADGEYTVRARVFQQAAGPDAAQASLHIGGQTFGPFDVEATSAAPMTIEQKVTVTKGSQQVSVEFLNDFYEAASGMDRNLVVDWIEISGPPGSGGGSSAYERIVSCDPTSGEACLRTILGDFAERAWRREIADTEIDPLLALVDGATAEGDDIDEGLKLAVRGILTSPHFIFRVEIDTDPASPVPHKLNDFEIASRLSYFVWSSMPDDELFDAAKAGSLQDEAEVAAQVARMLEDGKSSALVDNFAGQWLYTRALAEATPNAEDFPDFDEELRESMRAEADLFFKEFLRGEMAIDQLLDAEFTFLNDRLATHYGLPLPGSSDLAKVQLDSDQRGGLLKQGGLLTLTSNPGRTSPVKRGKWILTQILCSEPPPPPAGVEGFEEKDLENASIREKLEAHRQDPVCASCHDIMDPIGLAMENYDAIGAWRTKDNGFDVDASGVMPGGEEFDGANEMAGLISKDPRFAKCAAEKVFTYALGSGEGLDEHYLEQVTEKFAAGGLKLNELIALVATSEPFLYRRGEPAEGGKP
jgi:hypothetical protein